ncbi:hypothetical protein WA026_015243 [Henosepilachna vigintioctopunctata]|uniref:Glucose-methanol-choline oxidoreductase N-terminal domain-containing protein n=1 Tax=Henosepilachna vigintioctopunctata TaxID=420089 RepID=A0AAW1TU96_9CUCU
MKSPRIPSMSFNLLHSKYNWGYLTTQQKNWCAGSNNRQCLLGMGKALGGSTVINGMLWVRGNPKDYDLWAQQGNPGWSYQDVLPYFKKLEYAKVKKFSNDHQGKGGKVHVENSHFMTPATEYVLRAAHELGIPYINYNSGNQMGIGHAQGTLKDGSRWSSAKAYLEHSEERRNLIIKTKSTVLKVLIDDNKRAYGVQYIRNGKLYEVHAIKDVVLSAGGMSTPKLLALSGIGPEKDLKKFGIKALSNLNVGSPLLTHILFPGIRFIFNSTLPPVNEKRDILDYLTKGTGPLTAFSSDLVTFFRTEISNHEDKNYPDIELTFAPKRVRVETTSEDKLAASVSLVLLRPKSFGEVKLSSNDPLQPPLINPNYFTDDDDIDMKTLLAGVRIAQKFANTTIFKKYGGVLDSNSVLSCKNLPFDSDQYWRCAIQQQIICLSDPAGTAKMGPESDKDAVVDYKLRVYGIKNLRVVDNSVIPVWISGHMMAPAYMIGEKGADIIKMFWTVK